MGKLLEESAFIENKTKDYIEQVSNRSIYMEGNFIPVTYYSKNEQASTTDIGLGNVVELVGSESPIKYNKIENVPLYGVDEASLTYDFDEEDGIDSPVESSGNIPSGIIKPKPDDYFVIPSINKEYLFRVNNISASNIKGNFIYHIEFDLSGSDVNILEERQVTESYKVDYDISSSNKLTIIETSLYDEIESLNEMIDKIRKNYVKDFYCKQFNQFISKEKLYSNYLAEFINKSQIFIERKTFRSNIYVIPDFNVDYDYYKTIYFALLEGTNTDIYGDLNTGFIKTKITNPKRYIIFNRTPESFYTDTWFNVDSKAYNLDIKEICNEIVMYDYSKPIILDDIKHDDKINFISKIFILFYLNYDKHERDKSSLMRYIINSNFNSLRFSEEAYMFVPCILYILIETRNKLLKITSEL